VRTALVYIYTTKYFQNNRAAYRKSRLLLLKVFDFVDLFIDFISTTKHAHTAHIPPGAAAANNSIYRYY
jgi:hypothetical protein